MPDIQVIGRHYPYFLRSEPIWALWLKGTKIPYSAKYDGFAKSNDPDTWATFDEVIEKAKQSPKFYGGVSIAMSLDYSLVFIDIDDCIDENGTVNETGAEILDLFQDCYTEVSSSGTGLHVLTLGYIPENFKNSKAGVEIYSSGRFCALTGHVVSDGPLNITQEPLDYIYAKYHPIIKNYDYEDEDEDADDVEYQKPELTDADRWILKHAAKNWSFCDLYSGCWDIEYASQSEADIALCGILAFWTNCNKTQMDRIFQHSGLYREKWDRPDYKARTLETAIANCTKTISSYIEEKERQKK